jgi:hypothetical protein
LAITAHSKETKIDEELPDPKKLSPPARFNMAGPSDLLRKLNYNIELITSARKRTVAAWATLDAAITAWSMVDWCHQAIVERVDQNILKEAVRDEMLADIPALDACYMMATASKHFTVKFKPVKVHNSVIDMREQRLDPATQNVIREKSYLPIVYWKDNAMPADEFFDGIANALDAYLRKRQIDWHTTYLDEVLDPDD